MQLLSVIWTWYLFTNKYIEEYVQSYDKYIKENYKGFYFIPTMEVNKFLKEYFTEIETSTELYIDQALHILLKF